VAEGNKTKLDLQAERAAMLKHRDAGNGGYVEPMNGNIACGLPFFHVSHVWGLLDCHRCPYSRPHGGISNEK
jgi:hypothetical protein